MKVVKKIRPVSLGKIFGAIYGGLGLLFGGVFLIIVIIASLFSSERNFGNIFLAVVVIVLVPIFYGAFGYVSGVIFGGLYNLAAKWTGGLEVEIEDETNKVDMPH